MDGSGARGGESGPGALRRWLDRATETWAPPKPADLSGPFRLLLWLTRSQGRRVMLGALLGTAWMVGLTLPPWVLSRVVDDGLAAHDTAALVRWTLILLAISVVNALLGIARHRTMTKIRMDASFRCVRTTVWHTSRLGASLRRRLSTGEVVTVGIADVQTVAQALTVTGPGFGAVVAYLVVAIVLFTISPLLAAIVLAGVPLLAVAVGPFLGRIARLGGDYRAHQGQLTTRLVDILAGLRVLSGLGGKAGAGERYARESQDLVRLGYRVAGPASWVGALATGLPALFLAAVVWVSARLAATGQISIGDIVAVYGYVAMLVVPVAQFIEAGADLARARVAGQRIVDLLRLPVPGDAAQGEPPPAGAAMHDPASGVTIRPGRFTALVAERPAEALAVVERLGGLATDPEGATWGGTPIGTIPREELRRRLVVADNDAEVFAGTVREVVAGRHSSDDRRLQQALHTAVVEDVVEALPGGPDTTIAAGGSDLSGGQRQRIRLARAVYAAPEVLLAAEPTSAVDAVTEAAVMERLRAARRGRTTVVTTTSPLVLDRADEVVVLADGRVRAVGTHRQLLRDDHRYRDMVSRAQSEAEPT